MIDNTGISLKILALIFEPAESWKVPTIFPFVLAACFSNAGIPLLIAALASKLTACLLPVSLLPAGGGCCADGDPGGGCGTDEDAVGDADVDVSFAELEAENAHKMTSAKKDFILTEIPIQLVLMNGRRASVI